MNNFILKKKNKYLKIKDNAIFQHIYINSSYRDNIVFAYKLQNHYCI